MRRWIPASAGMTGVLIAESVIEIMKTVLITGANGALGRVLTARLKAENGVRVVTTDCATENGCAALDVREPKQMAKALTDAKPDIVIHLAASFTNDFAEAYALNVEAARNLLAFALTSKMEARIVLIGSAAEYGAIRPDDNPMPEDRILNPVSVYGLTKAWQTQLAGFYAGLGADAVVARIFNLDGPNLSERLFIGRIQKQIRALQASERKTIDVGPLSAIRDYVSLEEASRQILAIARYGKAGQVYNVASGEPVLMRDLLARILSAHGLDMSIVREAESLSNRTGYDVPVIYADMTRTNQLMSL